MDRMSLVWMVGLGLPVLALHLMSIALCKALQSYSRSLLADRCDERGRSERAREVERFDHKNVALREIAAHLLLGFCKDDVRGIQMPRIAAQCSKPAVEIGLVMRHEVRKSLHPIMRTMWIKDYRKEASESVILDEYIMIFHHSWPNSTGRSRANARDRIY